MNEDLTVKQRLIEFLSYKGLSQKNFALQCGLSNGFVNNIVQSIQPKTLNRITMQFPDLNPAWLLTGEGDMIRTHEISQKKIDLPAGTPIYDIDSSEHNAHMFVKENISGYISLPFISKTSAIITASGDSMKPIINSGDKIVVREIKHREYLYYGQIYFIITQEYRMIKYIRKHPTNLDIVILRSENQNYDDIELPRDQILRLFVIENIISIKNIV